MSGALLKELQSRIASQDFTAGLVFFVEYIPNDESNLPACVISLDSVLEDRSFRQKEPTKTALFMVDYFYDSDGLDKTIPDAVRDKTIDYLTSLTPFFERDGSAIKIAKIDNTKAISIYSQEQEAYIAGCAFEITFIETNQGN